MSYDRFTAQKEQCSCFDAYNSVDIIIYDDNNEGNKKPWTVGMEVFIIITNGMQQQQQSSLLSYEREEEVSLYR
jgi:hypothetical protein